MVRNVERIIQFIDDYLEENGRLYLNPPEANSLLDHAEILTDIEDHSGFRLRQLLRKGLIPHAFQPTGKHGRWYIPHSKAERPKVQKLEPVRVHSKTPTVDINIIDLSDNDVSKVESLKQNGFRLIGTMEELFNQGLPPIVELNSCGIYAISLPNGYEVDFLSLHDVRSKNNVRRPWSLEKLKLKWVENVEIIYYGLAGKHDFRSLKIRLGELISHGLGKTKSWLHKGGEIMWQLDDFESFSVWIFPTDPPPVPREREIELLASFKNRTGKLPFANRHG